MADIVKSGSGANQPNQDPASQVLALQKRRSTLSGMDMPGASTAPTEDGTPPPVAQTEGAAGYTDPDTGETTDKEPGAEEGDLYLDYVSPVKNLFTGGLAAAGRMAANKGLSYLRENMPGKSAPEEESPVLNYGAMRAPRVDPDTANTMAYNKKWQQGAGNTTDATTGFKKTPGITPR